MVKRSLPTIIKNYFKKIFTGLKSKISELINAGLSPQKLALAITAGIVFGSFPLLIPGITTILCMTFGVLLKLNLGLTQMVNLACTPFQVLLYLPFLQTGKWMFRLSTDITLTNLISQFKENFWGTFKLLGMLNLAGIVAWVVFALIIGIVIYNIILLLIRNFKPIEG